MFMDLPGGLKMPIVGLGTGGSLRQKDVVESALNAALELGYRHIDTAFSYENEEFIGNVLRQWFSSGKLKREDLFFTTKLPIVGVHVDRVEMFMKKSLQNLQLDYVDLYLIHFPIGTNYSKGQVRPGDKVEFSEHTDIWKKMEEQVNTGRTKTIGLSNFNQRQTERIIESARIKPACLQIELHVDFLQQELVKYCHQNDITVVAYSPLGLPGYNTIELRKIPDKMNDVTIKKIAKKYKKSTAQVMLRYLIQNNIVVIPRSSNPIRLKENINIFDFTLDSDDLKILESLEAGEDARIWTFRNYSIFLEHSEYPFPK